MDHPECARLLAVGFALYGVKSSKADCCIDALYSACLHEHITDWGLQQSRIADKISPSGTAVLPNNLLSESNLFGKIDVDNPDPPESLPAYITDGVPKQDTESLRE